jgi:hypothetical protein
MAALSGTNEYMVIMNDLHEIRGYNRLAKMASARFLVFLQDDDAPQKVREEAQKVETASRVNNSRKLSRALAASGCAFKRRSWNVTDWAPVVHQPRLQRSKAPKFGRPCPSASPAAAAAVPPARQPRPAAVSGSCLCRIWA